MFLQRPFRFYLLGFAAKVLLICALLVELFPVALASNEKDYCDPNLNAPADHPYRYSRREDRCEGIYIQEVASTALHVVSLTDSFEDYDLDIAKDLLVEWTASGDNAVQLRAQGLRRRLYYRMDTIRAGNTNSYRWSLALLAALNIPKDHLGVIGWTRTVVGQVERSVYLPLRISQRQQPRQLRRYQLVLLPGQELAEVFISVATVGLDGQPASFLCDGEALGYGHYPAEWAITIPIPYPEAAGFFYLEIGATLRGGGVSATELWFYHPHR
jgi:hypothetical protein